MASAGEKPSRIRDVVRDSKIRWDTLSKIDPNFDTDHDRKAGRVFPRTQSGEFGECYEGIQSRSIESEYPGYGSTEKTLYQQTHRKFTFPECQASEPKVKLPIFDGSSHTLDFLDWIDTIEDYFEAEDPPEAMKCKVAASKLKGGARKWWKELQDIRFSEGKSLITTWPRMRKLLIKKFLHTSCLTYFHKQKNEDNVKHTKCSTKALCESGNNKQCEKSDYYIPGESYTNVSDYSTKLTQVVGRCVKQVEEEKKSTESYDEEDTLGKSPIDEQSIEIYEVEPTKCLIKILAESNTDKQVGKLSNEKKIEQISGDNIVLLEDTQEGSDSEGAELELNQKVTSMNPRQLPISVFVLPHPSKLFWELIMSNNLNLKSSLEVKVDIKSAEITWLIGVVVILKSFIGTLGDRLVSNSIAEAALFLFDPGGSPTFQNVGNCLFLNYGIIFKNEVVNEVTFHIDSKARFDDVMVDYGSEATIIDLPNYSWLGNLGERVHVFCVCDFLENLYEYDHEILEAFQENANSHDISIQNTKGLGYAIHTVEEFILVNRINGSRGVIIDQLYMGKLAFERSRSCCVLARAIIGCKLVIGLAPRSKYLLIATPGDIQEEFHIGLQLVINIDLNLCFSKLARTRSVQWNMLINQDLRLCFKAWSDIRSEEIAFLFRVVVVLKFLFDDKRNMKSLIYGECMNFNYFITKIVSFLFDPGGVLNFENSDWDSPMMLKEKDAKRNALRLCAWVGNALDSLMLHVLVISLKPCDRLGWRTHEDLERIILQRHIYTMEWSASIAPIIFLKSWDIVEVCGGSIYTQCKAIGNEMPGSSEPPDNLHYVSWNDIISTCILVPHVSRAALYYAEDVAGIKEVSEVMDTCNSAFFGPQAVEIVHDFKEYEDCKPDISDFNYHMGQLCNIGVLGRDLIQNFDPGGNGNNITVVLEEIYGGCEVSFELLVKTRHEEKLDRNVGKRTDIQVDKRGVDCEVKLTVGKEGVELFLKNMNSDASHALAVRAYGINAEHLYASAIEEEKNYAAVSSRCPWVYVKGLAQDIFRQNSSTKFLKVLMRSKVQISDEAYLFISNALYVVVKHADVFAVLGHMLRAQVILLLFKGHWNYNLHITRGRVAGKRWNDENDVNTERKLIMVKISVAIIDLWVNILCDIGYFKMTMRLFFKLVNGLDPPNAQ